RDRGSPARARPEDRHCGRWRRGARRYEIHDLRAEDRREEGDGPLHGPRDPRDHRDHDRGDRHARCRGPVRDRRAGRRVPVREERKNLPGRRYAGTGNPDRNGEPVIGVSGRTGRTSFFGYGLEIPADKIRLLSIDFRKDTGSIRYDPALLGKQAIDHLKPCPELVAPRYYIREYCSYNTHSERCNMKVTRFSG